jgi:predicted MFS family arabinose efflux permease
MKLVGTSVWRDRNFRLVLGGGFVNNVGDWLLAVALPAFVYSETHSGRSTAAIVIIELLIGICFGPYGGGLADRWDLRRTIIGTNLLQAVTLLPLLAVTSDRIWPAFVVAAAHGLLRAVNDPASFALVPRIVAPEQLVKANAANSASGSIARLIGSPLGGIAVAYGGLSAVVVIDAVTFVTVALATTFVRADTASLALAGDDGEQARASVREGWRQIRQHSELVGYLAVQSLASLTFAMFPVLFIAFVIDVLEGDEATVGIIRGMAAFGGLTASVLIARRATHVHPTMLMAFGYAGLGSVAFIFVNISGLTTAVWLYLLLFGLSGFPNITSQVGAVGTAQRLCPPQMLGRLQGLEGAGGAAGAIVGSAAVALLLDEVGVKLLLNVQAALYVTCGVGSYIFIARVVRRRDDSPADDARDEMV